MFHIAFPIEDLEKTTAFYTQVLGCEIGRSSTNWMDFNFFGHQLTAEVQPSYKRPQHIFRKDGVPSHHFGVVLGIKEWHTLKDRLEELSVPFLIQPRLFLKGEIGEQYTFFIEDPNGYAIEFKGFERMENVFRSE